MAQRNRISSQKRDRERRKAEKAEQKRERRQQRKDGTLPAADVDVRADEGSPAEASPGAEDSAEDSLSPPGL